MTGSNILIITIILSSLFLAISCDSQNNRIEKIELEDVSLFADTTPPKIFTWTLEAKTDTTLQLAMIIPAEEAVEPPVNLNDTIAKYKYKVEEVFIDSLGRVLYSSQIICTDNNKTIMFRARAIDAIKIAKRSHSPIFADKKLLQNKKNISEQ